MSVKSARRGGLSRAPGAADNKVIFFKMFVYILHRANLIVDCILEKSDARTGGLSEAVGVFGP